MKKFFQFIFIITLFGCSDNISQTAEKFNMDVCGDEILNKLDNKKITDAFSKILNGSCKDNPFIIIGNSKNKMEYIQILLNEDTRNFTLEFQDGSIDKHFESVQKLNSTEALKVLIEYSRSSKQWNENISWQRIKI